MDVFIGIDVACAKHKYLPITICYHEGNRLIPLPLACHPVKPPGGLGNAATLLDSCNSAFAEDTAAYIDTICTCYDLTPVCIGIDSPLQPRDNHLERRLAEQALDAAGISCYTTPSADDFERIKRKGLLHLDAGKPLQNLPHSMQIFMLLGFALAERLTEIAQCIEVYPHATVKQLGAADVHKTNGKQAAQQLAAIGQYTGWPTTEEDWSLAENMCLGPMHDKVDAYSAAWVASLPSKERICFGDAEKDDAIWVPRVTQPQNEHVTAPNKPIKKQQHTDATHQKLCPACKQHVFKRWPFGWDAHAAYRCTGLTSTEPEARKAEFKRKYR